MYITVNVNIYSYILFCTILLNVNKFLRPTKQVGSILYFKPNILFNAQTHLVSIFNAVFYQWFDFVSSFLFERLFYINFHDDLCTYLSIASINYWWLSCKTRLYQIIIALKFIIIFFIPYKASRKFYYTTIYLLKYYNFCSYCFNICTYFTCVVSKWGWIYN